MPTFGSRDFSGGSRGRTPEAGQPARRGGGWGSAFRFSLASPSTTSNVGWHDRGIWLPAVRSRSRRSASAEYRADHQPHYGPVTGLSPIRSLADQLLVASVAHPNPAVGRWSQSPAADRDVLSRSGADSPARVAARLWRAVQILRRSAAAGLSGGRPSASSFRSSGLILLAGGSRCRGESGNCPGKDGGSDARLSDHPGGWRGRREDDAVPTVTRVAHQHRSACDVHAGTRGNGSRRAPAGLAFGP